MPSVLITGASRGIGHAIATHLAANGWDVIAGVRSDRDATRLKAANPRFTPVMLDITNSEHIAALDQSLPERLDAVVNNAGVVIGGPMEAVTLDELRRQFDVNVVAQIAVTQAALPRLRRSKGRIVFISSALGKVAVPLIGAYCASKAALEAAADALRMELKTWHLAVVLIEPGQTDTDMWRTANLRTDETVAAMSPETRELYRRHLLGFNKAIPKSQKTAVPSGKVAAVVGKALTTRWPRARYVVGAGPKLQIAVATKLPTGIRDRLINATSGQPT